MVGELGLSEAAYGLGSALFFLGYCIFGIPSNLILERVGPRLWFARIIGAWGLVTLALGFAWTPTKIMFNIGFTKRSEEHTSELQSLMRISYAVFCLKKKKYKYYVT